MYRGQIVAVVDGAGEENNGTYYVDEVQHQFSQDGYREGRLPFGY